MTLSLTDFLQNVIFRTVEHIRPVRHHYPYDHMRLPLSPLVIVSAQFKALIILYGVQGNE